MSAESDPALPNLRAVPGLPQDEEGAVFAAPWEAKAFALVVHLHQRGRFEWSEWVAALATEIAADRTRAEPTPYYLLWLTAAEHLVAARGLVNASQLASARHRLHAAQTGDPDHDHHDHDHDEDHHSH